MDFKSYILDVPDFPKKGILFKDISPLLHDPEIFQKVILKLGHSLKTEEIDAFAGIESRGFIFASALAARFQKGFIPLRKSGKLPPPVESETYQLEYGSATLEMKRGKGRVVLIDDVLATGGTLQASLKLCEKSGYQVQDMAVIINLTFLNQMLFNNLPIKSLIEY
jgi:adenine phosphoribosyltransferase